VSIDCPARASMRECTWSVAISGMSAIVSVNPIRPTMFVNDVEQA
jgi:hypothetical protein